MTPVATKGKKWHKYDSWSIIMSGLPRMENVKIENIHLYCCSDTSTAVEILESLVPELNALAGLGNKILALAAHSIHKLLPLAEGESVIRSNFSSKLCSTHERIRKNL